MQGAWLNLMTLYTNASWCDHILYNMHAWKHVAWSLDLDLDLQCQEGYLNLKPMIILWARCRPITHWCSRSCSAVGELNLYVVRLTFIQIRKAWDESETKPTVMSAHNNVPWCRTMVGGSGMGEENKSARYGLLVPFTIVTKEITKQYE